LCGWWVVGSWRRRVDIGDVVVAVVVLAEVCLLVRDAL
jgi:hypothetical protein